MSRFGFAAAYVVVCACAAIGEEPVTLKRAESWKAGDKVRYTETEKSKHASDFTVLGKTTKQTGEGSRLIVYVEEIQKVGKDGARPLKVTRTYEKFECGEDGKEEVGPPLNAPIVIEKKGDKYTFDAGGKKIDEEFAKKLDNEFNTPDDGKAVDGFVPDKPVRPGDTWKLPEKGLFGPFGAGGEGMKLDLKKLTATGKFVKVVTRAGRRFAEVEYVLAAPILQLGPGNDLAVQEGSFAANFTVEMSLDGRGGGGTTTTNKMNVKLTGKGSTVTISHESKNTTTEELLNK
jgi:hypothetical protein